MHARHRVLPLAVLLPLIACAAAPAENPAVPGEFGFRPLDASTSSRNPPAFVWRPQNKAATYDLEICRTNTFAGDVYTATGLVWNAHCPPKSFERGTWSWRFRFTDQKGVTSDWSAVRSFALDAKSVFFPMPPRESILLRVPATHPRLFLRPTDLPKLREEAAGARKSEFAVLLAACEKLMQNPPPTAEPPTYPDGLDRESDEWMKIWWGNRTYTINALQAAAMLGFAHQLGGPDAYAAKGREILMACAKWDPVGSTGYRYNDEAGMPYAYYFARAYTFLNDVLTDDDRRLCREVATVRGRAMYDHLCPKQFWKPYESHSNRAWHKLGELAIAFLNEVPEASDWLWFALNKQFCTYPVWNDEDGGWHEGLSYWQSYVDRFTMWADALRAATAIDVFKLPFFAKVGYYPMYLTPPGTPGSGFGDLNPDRRGDSSSSLVYTLAAQSRNPTWQWYAQQTGREPVIRDYIDYLRGARPDIVPVPPTNLPSSRVWRGVGQAALNTDLLAASNNVSLLFKSSPFGTQSHGYDAQNAFILYACGDRLLVSTGRRDQYGSAHHKNWMWDTKSVNSITVNGESQGRRTAEARGRITAFSTSPDLDYVVGDASEAYGGAVKTFTRHVVFVKPDLFVLYDHLETPAPASFEWRLHAPTNFAVNGPADVRVVGPKASCRVSFFEPSALSLSVTNVYDVPPRAKIKVREWHLTATPAAKSSAADFVTVIRPWRNGAAEPAPATFEKLPNGWRVKASTPQGEAVIACGIRPGQPPTFGVNLNGNARVLSQNVEMAGQP